MMQYLFFVPVLIIILIAVAGIFRGVRPREYEPLFDNVIFRVWRD